MIDSFLSPRLIEIANLAGAGSRVLDIGTDHAYIPIYLITKNIASFAIASDIRPGPVFRAKENVRRFGLEDKISVRQGNGFETVFKGEADTVIISGMGGPLVNEIIANGRKNGKISGKETLILQPQTADNEVREYLEGAGYTITDERICREDNKFYNIIALKAGTQKTGGGFSCYVNSHMMRSPVIKEYLTHKICVCQKIKSGLGKAKNQDGLEHVQWLIDNYEKALEAVT